MYFSYATLTKDDVHAESGMTLLEVSDMHAQRSYRIQLWPLMFWIWYLAFLMDIRLRFFPALIFILVTLAFFASISVWCPTISLFNFPLHLVGMCFAGVVCLIVSRMEEQQSRAHFELQMSIDSVEERIENILKTLMPPLVIAEINELMAVGDDELPSHHYPSATIAQSDLVGFTQLASTRSPREVVDFISELFGLFDDLTDVYGVYKIETVGDAYIAGQASPPLTLHHRPLSVVLFGIEMIWATQRWASRRGLAVNSRVGVHTGKCTGGIVGTEMQRYHIFGELMTIVEVLESTAPKGFLQLSRNCKEVVDQQIYQEKLPLELFTFEARAEAHLQTSKGDIVEFSEAGGGPTFILQDCKPKRYPREAPVSD